MIVEQYKNHKIKLVEKPHGFAIIRTYEVWKDKALYFKALTIKDAKQKIDNGKNEKTTSKITQIIS